MLTNREFIPIAAPDSINIFRDEDGGVYYKDDTGKVHVTLSYHDVYKIENPKFKYYNVLSDEKISVLKSSQKDFIFALYRVGAVVGGMGGNGGGGRGRRGIIVQDEGAQVNGIVNTLNFAGASVTVTDDGGGKVTVTIGGGGMITGGGTVNRIAMFTPVGTAIGDSPLLRSGSDVIADGNLFFASGNGIDVVATGGSDVLSIGVNNADVINYGYSGTTHNFSGTTFNEFTTNLNVKDKLITINSGGAAGSGGGSGFEIEEGGSITGYFIQNVARTGFDFQASGVTGVATFNLSNLTGNQTASLQDASGTLAYLSDIPVVTPAWFLDGNTVGSEKFIGTIDGFAFPIRTSNTERGRVDASGLWGINASPIAATQFFINGAVNNYAFRVDASNGASPNAIVVRKEGYVGIGLDPIFGFDVLSSMSTCFFQPSVQIANTNTAAHTILSLGETHNSATPFYIDRYGSTTASPGLVEINNLASTSFQSSGNVKIFLASSGYVGLGAVTTPGCLFDMKGISDGTNPIFRIKENTNTYTLFQVINDSKLTKILGGTDATALEVNSVGFTAGTPGTLVDLIAFNESSFYWGALAGQYDNAIGYSMVFKVNEDTTGSPTERIRVNQFGLNLLQTLTNGSYANNAAAVAAIGSGGVYYTDVAGEYILKLAH